VDDVGLGGVELSSSSTEASLVAPDNPSEHLVGATLDADWTVIEMIVRSPDATGGHFSTSYRARDGSGRWAFLKALDFSSALASLDPAQELMLLTSHFVFEGELLRLCTENGLDRVVRMLGSGTIVGGTVPVPYLILELADRDIRDHLDQLINVEVGWVLASLHQVAVGLEQLHGIDVAHQDLKPSNVLEFSNGTVARIGDVGRASLRASASPFDGLFIAGDIHYAPPELLYREVDSDWRRRRFAYDMYLFGSLVVFVFSQVSMTGLLFSQLPAQRQLRDL